MLTWAEAYQAGPDVCGGKAWNLGRLDRYGFRVPRGGVLPAGFAISDVRPGLEKLGLTHARLAVRSSATAEDSARASFAGIHSTFLNVQGIDNVEAAVQGCLDSLQTETAIAYRRRMGFGDEEVQCAVVLCEMVPARCAGVAFTCDPASGRRDLFVIDAAEGLGEAVVSGRVNPHRIVYHHHRQRWQPFSGSGQFPALTPDQELELIHLIHRIHWALGEGQDPQDIEWAHDGERFWLLQSRPVTHLRRAGFAATAHLPRYWSTSNIKDAVPGVVSELSWSLLQTTVSTAAYAPQQAAGYQVPPGMEVVRRFQGRGYFDFTQMQWAYFDAFAVRPADMFRNLGGHQPEIEVPPGDPKQGPDGKRRNKAGLRLLRRIWNYDQVAAPALKQHHALQRQLSAQPLDRLTLPELRAIVEQITDAQLRIMPVAGLANACSGPWEIALRNLVKDPALLSRLQAGAGNVVSAEQGYRLYDIAAGRATLEQFLEEFGHRAVYEADILNPRWAEDPSWLLEQIEAIRHSPPPRSPRELAATVRGEAEAELRRRHGWKTPLLLWLVNKLRRAMAVREAAKSQLVAMLLPLRRVTLEAGRRLTAAGHLDSPVQALHLSAADLFNFLLESWDGAGARALCEDRRLRRLHWLSQSPPDVITEEPNGVTRFAAEPAATPVNGRWSGIAASPGQVTGPARLIHHPSESARLLPGEILVAPSTDPGWTPLFLRASAIVMETGGYLSHGAIVAREFGLPAAVNLPGILNSLKDGEILTVDGDTGSVLRHANSAT
jgi:pyruvate,water dikinase